MAETTQSPERIAAAIGAALFALASVAGCGFFSVSDVATSCNLVDHTGCTASQACVSVEAPQCAAIGSKVAGEACTRIDDCVRSAVCYGGDNAKTCLPRCALASPSCADANHSCLPPGNTPNPNGLGLCQALPCDPIAQTGCASGRCIPGPLPYCSEVIGVAGEGSACASSEGCKKALVCAESIVDGVAESHCIRVCDASAAEGAQGCDEGHVCRPLKDGAGRALPGAQGYCVLDACNALTNAGCSEAQKCYPTTGKPACSFPGNVGKDGACSKPSDCGIGLMCIQGGDGALTCRQTCDASGADPAYACADGKACSEVKTKDGKPLPNNLGICSQL